MDKTIPGDSWDRIEHGGNEWKGRKVTSHNDFLHPPP